MIENHLFWKPKGQIKLKEDWRVVDSPKKRTNEFVLFAFLLFTAKKSNLFVRFLGESTARQSWFRFYLTFTVCATLRKCLSRNFHIKLPFNTQCLPQLGIDLRNIWICLVESSTSSFFKIFNSGSKVLKSTSSNVGPRRACL